MCNSGVGLTPTVRGSLHHFSAGGLYNGLVLMVDDETGTYWDHVTGEAVHGALRGEVLDSWPLRYTTVAVALAADPGLKVARQARRGLKARAMEALHRKKIGSSGFLPPPFRMTMGEEDDRLPTMEQGLGVVVDGAARFFPTASLRAGPRGTEFAGRALEVSLGEDRVPQAVWSDDHSRPMQLFTRWYGFSYTFPGCAIER